MVCLLLAMVYMAFSLGSSVTSCGCYVMSLPLYTISHVVVSVAFLFSVDLIS